MMSTDKLMAVVAGGLGTDLFGLNLNRLVGKGATVADVRLLKAAIAGTGLGIKASAGIRDYATAAAMVEAGADRLGTSAGVSICDGAPVGV